MAEPAARQSADEGDRRLMAAALRLGRRHLALTSPAPSVGALIVKETPEGPVVIARGCTAIGGRPHAEALALTFAGEAARGATAYVTLEPCAHKGRGEPCASALIAAGVRRVVTAMEDPDPRTAGAGHALLRKAGITVVTGVLEEEARIIHGGHVLRVTANRPRIILKLAVSADGMIGRASGERMMISGPEAFALVQVMRAESDAVMIGINTALVDDPRLTVRLAGLEKRTPVRIVLDAGLRLPLGSHLASTAREIPVWLIGAEGAPLASRQALSAQGVTVLATSASRAGVDLEKALAQMAERGLTRVLAEGGSQLASSLLSAGFADEIVLFHASVLVGSAGIRAFAGQALSAVEHSPRFHLVEEVSLGEDRMRRYLRAA